MADYKRIMRDGIWDNNVVMAQMLALCPLLAVTSTATNGLGMGLATLAVLLASNVVVSLLRNIISNEVRIPVFILLIATIVTLVDLGMNAWMHDLHKVLGLFIPLIVTNCAILARAESFASREAVAPAAFDALMMGLGFTLVLVLFAGGPAWLLHVGAPLAVCAGLEQAAITWIAPGPRGEMRSLLQAWRAWRGR